MREVPAKPQVLFLTKAQEGRVTRQVCAVVSPSPRGADVQRKVETSITGHVSKLKKKKKGDKVRE